MLPRVSYGETVADIAQLLATSGHGGGATDIQTQESVFEEIYLVFLVLGVIVGVVVISYMLYNAWRYRAGAGHELEDPPTLGELPVGEGGGKKLAVSFGLSALIVLSLIVWSYSAVIYVETGPQAEDNMEIDIEASQFNWEFTYENGESTIDELYIPEDQLVRLEVTSRHEPIEDLDVWHTFGATELRIKADAIPGQYATEWVVADEQGTYRVECYELCGPGHSDMTGEIIVVDQDDFDDWYELLSEDPEAAMENPPEPAGEA